MDIKWYGSESLSLEERTAFHARFEPQVGRSAASRLRRLPLVS